MAWVWDIPRFPKAGFTEGHFETSVSTKCSFDRWVYHFGLQGGIIENEGMQGQVFQCSERLKVKVPLKN